MKTFSLGDVVDFGEAYLVYKNMSKHYPACARWYRFHKDALTETHNGDYLTSEDTTQSLEVIFNIAYAFIEPYPHTATSIAKHSMRYTTMGLPYTTGVSSDDD